MPAFDPGQIVCQVVCGKLAAVVAGIEVLNTVDAAKLQAWRRRAAGKVEPLARESPAGIVDQVRSDVPRVPDDDAFAVRQQNPGSGLSGKLSRKVVFLPVGQGAAPENVVPVIGSRIIQAADVGR